MSNLVVYADVVGVRAIEEKFSSWSRRAADVTPLYTEIAGLMMQYEAEMFATDGAISGEAWEQLTDETMRTKAQKGYPPDIEVATEETKSALTIEGASGQILEITPEFLRFGTDLEQAAYQQFGTPNRHNMPARKLFNFRPQDLEAFSMMVYLYVTKGTFAVELFQL